MALPGRATVASFWYDQYQQIRLSAQQTKEWLDFARYLSSASAGDVEILDNRIVLDGLPIYYGLIWNLPPLGSFPPSISVQVGLDLNWEVAPFPSYPGLKLRCIQMVHPTIGEIRPYLKVSCDGVSSRGFHNSSTSRSVDCWFSYDKDKKRFKEEAERRGLSIDYDQKIGWSLVQPTPALKTFCTAQHWRNKLTISRSGGMGGKEPKPKAPSSTRKYVCPCCGQSIRATKDVHLICADCNQELVKAS